MKTALKIHWPEYLIEAWCLATFMVSACMFGVVLFHSASPFAGVSFAIRNTVMGIAMGFTAIGIICSRWGQRSGAHFNPAVTLTFLRLGKIAGADATFYVISHFVGGVLGVLVSWLVLGDLLSDSMVNFVSTVPGRFGAGGAFVAEILISFLMMTMILWTSNSRKFSRLTPFLAGAFVAIYITFESPISGTSLNPARTFASAVFSGTWKGWWVYFIGPPLAMLAAAELFVRLRGLKNVLCAKLHHDNPLRCIFKCGYHEQISAPIEVTENLHLFPSIAGLF